MCRSVEGGRARHLPNRRSVEPAGARQCWGIVGMLALVLFAPFNACATDCKPRRRDQIGIVTDARIEAGQLIASARLSPRDDVKGIATDLASGTPPNVSVGYRVYASVEGTDGNGRRTITHTDWEPFEMSLVAIPADPKAHVRNLKGNSMRKKQTPNEQQIDLQDDDLGADTSVRVRSEATDQDASRDALAILDLAAASGMTVGFARQHIAAGSSIDKFRLAVLDEKARSTAHIIVSRSGDAGAETLDDPAFLSRSIEDALVARMTGKPAKGAATELMGRSLLDMGAMLVQARGERPSWGNRDRLLAQVMERSGGSLATSDFPNLLTTSGNRVLQDAYQVSQTPLLQIAKRRDAVDFRPLTTIKLSEAPKLAEVKEGGEVTHGSRSESKESFKLKTYAKIFSLRRAENLYHMIEKAKKKLENAGVDNPDAPPKLAIPIMIAAADESRDELQDLWATLLAAAADPKKSSSFRLKFIEVVKQFDPIDAAVLIEAARKNLVDTQQLKLLAEPLSLREDEVSVSLANLETLGLFVRHESSGRNYRHLNQTAFGRELLRTIGSGLAPGHAAKA
jgi:hypothetical protein